MKEKNSSAETVTRDFFYIRYMKVLNGHYQTSRAWNDSLALEQQP